MLTRRKITTLLQIFHEPKLFSQVIFKSMRIADDTFQGNSECEQVSMGCSPSLSPASNSAHQTRPFRLGPVSVLHVLLATIVGIIRFIVHN